MGQGAQVISDLVCLAVEFRLDPGVGGGVMQENDMIRFIFGEDGPGFLGGQGVGQGRFQKELPRNQQGMELGFELRTVGVQTSCSFHPTLHGSSLRTFQFIDTGVQLQGGERVCVAQLTFSENSGPWEPLLFYTWGL